MDSFGHISYKNFKRYDESPISVELWEDCASVPVHRHRHFEFAVITRGSCLHYYRNVSVPLIPGDVFLIEPEEPHGYEIQSHVTIINCLFYPKTLNDENSQMMESAWRPAEDAALRNQWEDLLQFVTLEEDRMDPKIRQAGLNAQGIIHLEKKELEKMEGFLRAMIQEQEEQEEYSVDAKSAYLQLILVLLSRVQRQKTEQIRQHSHTKKDLIYHALVYIDEHLEQRINFNELAEQGYMSPAYFRRIFKDVTGLTPTDYLNRMRIVKSLEYLEKEKSTIADAAAMVGIYDANYYSRMFKKVMGYSPRYFKSIR